MMLGVTSFREDFERVLLWLHCTEQQLNEREEDLNETQQVCYLFCRGSYFASDIRAELSLLQVEEGFD